ncbi:YaeC family lipoprotein, partial [Burkholderia sp. TJI49]
MRRSILTSLAALGAVLAFAAPGAHADPTLKIGTMSGPDAQIWTEVTKVAAREGLAIKVIEFND